MATPANQLSVAECDRLLTKKGGIFEMEDVNVGGNVVRAWKHAPRTFRDFFSDRCAKWSSRTLISSPRPYPAAYHDRDYYTYSDVYIRATHLAAWMREHGCGYQTRVALGGNNSADWVIAFIAIHLIGACPVLVNATLHRDIQIHCLTLTKPKLVLCEASIAEQLGSFSDALEAGGVGRIYCWDTVSGLSREVRKHVTQLHTDRVHPISVREVEHGVGLENLSPDSDGMIMFTSGTTNLPKGVLLTQRACLQHVIASSYPGARAAMRAGMPVDEALALHVPPEDRQVAMLLAVPLFHVTGNMGWMSRGFHMGMKIVFLRRWNTDDAIDVIVNEGVTVVGGVPSIAVSLLQSPNMPKNYPMENVTYGGAPPSKRLAKDIVQSWPTAVPTHAWGMTETCGLHNGLTGQDYIDNPEAVGQAVPTCEIRVVDPETRKVLPPWQMGILEARGSNCLKEYVDNPKATAEAVTADGWLDTGDMAWMDEVDNLYIRDRAKDVIIRGGENIASQEVENAIAQDSRIAECAAVPVPDERLGERVGMAVSLAPGVEATPADIIRTVAPRLRFPARPAIVVILPLLPRNGNGKIVKADCKKIVGEAWEAQGRMETPTAKL